LAERNNNIMISLRDEIGRLFIISFGVFLFILFFQPFPLETLDYNSRLLYVTGFGLIVFFAAVIALVVLPSAIPKWFDVKNEWENGPPVQLSFVLIILILTSFLFYIKWVGNTNLSLYIMFKAALVSMLPLAVMIHMYKSHSMEREITTLQDQNKDYITMVRNYENAARKEEIDIFTDTREKKFTLRLSDILLIKSADNYIEFYFWRDVAVEKKLIRCTLKSVEIQLANSDDLIRCHRSVIFNRKYIEKLVRSYSGYSLKLKNLDERIPVSRHYVNAVKEVLQMKIF
jgi:hypothetical protein